MKCLTVRQPWAWAIIHGGKDIENRLVRWRHRGPLAIHASAPRRDDTAYINTALASPYFDPTVIKERHQRIPGLSDYFTGAPMFRGVVLGVVDLTDAHLWVPGCCDRSKWAMPDCVHLRVENPRPLMGPVAAKGRLGLWDLPADVEAAVLAGLGPVGGDQ